MRAGRLIMLGTRTPASPSRARDLLPHGLVLWPHVLLLYLHGATCVSQSERKLLPFGNLDCPFKFECAAIADFLD